MNSQEAGFLYAQLQGLTEILSELPSDELMERVGLEARVAEVKSQIEALALDKRPRPAIAEVTFRGNPVLDSRGIQAQFASKVVGAFERSVATIASSRVRGPLPDSGRLPDREFHRLLITGTALGSFGFRFEEVPDEYAPIESLDSTSLVTKSLHQAIAILEACATSDERLVDALGEASPRVLVPIQEFLAAMHNNEATCSVSVNDVRFRFDDNAQVEAALDRATVGVKEETETLYGVLRDILRDSRKFDFRTDSAILINGKIAREVDTLDAWQLLRDQHVKATFDVRVAGRVKFVRRYTLVNIERYDG